jgi:hypothetical protein
VYAANSIQWQDSIDITTPFANVSGAASLDSLPSPANVFTKYYRAKVSDGVGNVCFTTSPFALVFNDPVATVTKVRNTRCGSGDITITAYASPGAKIRWYESDASSTALGDTSYTADTSYYTITNLTSTKVVYVSAEIGTGVTACASTRIPDTAIASDPPVLSVTADQSICNGAITNLSVASNLADYDTYVWSPTDSLYTNPDATTRYIAGQSNTSLYIKSTRPGKIKYTVTSSSSGCSNTTTTTVSTQLLSASINAQPDKLHTAKITNNLWNKYKIIL